MNPREILLDLFKAVDPDGSKIDEKNRTLLLESFDSKIKTMKEGMYDEVLKSVDEAHTNKINEAAKLLTESFEKKLDDYDAECASNLKLVVESLNAKNAKLLEEATDKLDAEAADKLKLFAEAVDKDHAIKLEQAVEAATKYAKETNVMKIDESFTKKMSQYLDTYLDTLVPKTVLINEARLAALSKFYDSVRKACFINDDFVQSEVKEALLDAKSIMESKDKDINSLMLEKVQLVQECKNKEAEILLREKTKSMSPKQKAFVLSMCKDKSPELIEESVNEATKAYEKEETEIRKKLREETTSQINPVKQQKEGIVTESIKEESPDKQLIDYYASITKKALR